MAQRLMCYCEICLDDDAEVPATPFYLKAGDHGGIVDLCDVHADQVYKPILALVQTHSRPSGAETSKRTTSPPVSARPTATGAKRVVESWPCPACPERPAPFGSATGLGYHALAVHGVALRDVTAVASERCRVTGCDWHAIGKDRRSITWHLSNEHGIANVATMTAQLNATDPERVEDLMKIWYRTALARS